MARDLGTALDTVATLATLVRTKVGQFTIEDVTVPDTLDPTSLLDRLVPIDVALAGMPRISVSPVQAQHLRQGKVVSGFEGSTVSGVDGFALALTEDHKFLAVVVSNGAELRTERIIYAD